MIWLYLFCWNCDGHFPSPWWLVDMCEEKDFASGNLTVCYEKRPMYIYLFNMVMFHNCVQFTRGCPEKMHFTLDGYRYVCIYNYIRCIMNDDYYYYSWLYSFNSCWTYWIIIVYTYTYGKHEMQTIHVFYVHVMFI